jgi:hypothetical protein
MPYPIQTAVDDLGLGQGIRPVYVAIAGRHARAPVR